MEPSPLPLQLNELILASPLQDQKELVEDLESMLDGVGVKPHELQVTAELDGEGSGSGVDNLDMDEELESGSEEIAVQGCILQTDLDPCTDDCENVWDLLPWNGMASCFELEEVAQVRTVCFQMMEPSFCGEVCSARVLPSGVPHLKNCASQHRRTSSSRVGCTASCLKVGTSSVGTVGRRWRWS